MKRLLCILSSMDAGGAETFLMKIYRKIDRNRYQIDFCINVSHKCFYEDEIIDLGGVIYRIPAKSDNLRGFKRELGNIISEGKYQNVLRITSNAMGFWDLKIAKKNGALRCCARSSNSSDGGSLKVLLAHYIGRILYSRYIDVKIAPSDLAAKYTFGRREYESGNVNIIKNGLDLSDYIYNKEIRQSIRNELKIKESTFVVGHVGRFSEQKNHKYLINVFRKIKDRKPDSVLLLVGDGHLYDQIYSEVKRLFLEDSVIFTGVRKDIPSLLFAMDVFVFPSLYEGMPNAVIEAQASGLPCLISERISRDANVNEYVRFMPLDRDYEKWAETTINLQHTDRIMCNKKMVNGQYDINQVVNWFEEVVFGVNYGN